MDAVATVLVRRLNAVMLPDAAVPAPADGGEWVVLLETDLADRGLLLDAPLRARFAGLAADVRNRWGDWLLATADAATGADREHLPLYRAFPNTPAEPQALFVSRLLAHVFQSPGAPCVLCGSAEGVHPLDPCGHLVCVACFDPAAYSACPICGRRLTGGNAYLRVTAPRLAGRRKSPPVRWRRLSLTPHTTVVRVRDELVARPAALNEADAADLRTLVEATAPGRLDWLPGTVPARETQALLIAWALDATVLTSAYDRVLGEAVARWSTATDAARALWAYSGGDAGLVLPGAEGADGPLEGWRPVDEPKVTAVVPRVRALPRPLRRAVLGFLDGLDLPTAAEDLARHPTVWKRLAERLHPFERVAAFPRAAVAFAALRGTRAPIAGVLATAMADAAAAHPDHVELSFHDDDTVAVRVRTFASLVEEAFACGDVPAVTGLLRRRPGDLWRRLDHLLRLAGDDNDARDRILDAVRSTAARVSPAVLGGAAAALAGRDGTVLAEQAAAVATAAARPQGSGRLLIQPVRTRPAPEPDYGPKPGTPRRTFFPKGDVVRTWTAYERRARLASDTIAAVRAAADAELVRRAAGLERFDVAVLDLGLAAVPAPMRERASSQQLAGWPRGSVRTLADLDVLRLFLHWTDTATARVDLDLSCGFYDEAWNPVGHCDFTNLRFATDAAIHSGDLTSAPPPLGATEFLDLHRARLRAAGATWAVPVVYSYNDVPFEQLTDAFAGFSRPGRDGSQFEGARVLQRFGLRGNAKALAPMILHVPSAQVMWVDASLSSPGYGHQIGGHGPRLGRIAADLWEHFTGVRRTTLLDLAAWHACARADRIVVVSEAGDAVLVPPSPAAVRAADGIETDLGSLAGQRVFAATTDAARLAELAGPDIAEGSAAILVDGLAAAPWTVTGAGDLAAGLVPLAPAQR
ncbi:MXAN_6230/SCO0854 family RING domain-containing protein [Hamadaea tsunoensis]|uniref:MXAN_6230/SCO0854 family RING domain-containing protein n=1 Tax=Hamadaea tsunoensis TaxID=53368 RepID=UPI000425E298|nr:MXAN_6230/SCO0854 family RING domain-containing protein [Hamadaea tsunoensis]